MRDRQSLVQPTAPSRVEGSVGQRGTAKQPTMTTPFLDQANYDLMLSDCFCHAYCIIGELGSRMYLLTRAG